MSMGKLEREGLIFAARQALERGAKVETVAAREAASWLPEGSKLAGVIDVVRINKAVVVPVAACSLYPTVERQRGHRIFRGEG
ncbi:MAG TPA: hypothetical protein VF407_11020 [Polyangiaceae bacterium]